MDATINWNLNSDALFSQMQQVNDRLLQMTRETNTQQLLLMQEGMNGMVSVMDNYVQRIRTSFDVILQLAQATWEGAKNENVRSFDEIKRQLDELTRVAKDSSNEQLKSVLDTINEKIQAEEKYVNVVKQSTATVITEKQKEIDIQKQLKEDIATSKQITSAVTSGLTTATGSETQTGLIDTGVRMFGKTVGSAIDMATLVEMGRGTMQLFEVLAQGVGILMNATKRNDVMKQELFNIFGGAGEQITDVYGKDFDIGAEGGMLNRVNALAIKYAGIKGFDRPTFQQTMGTLGQSRLYDVNQLVGMGESATMLGKGTGMQGSEVAEIFNQLILKLNVPIDDLSGRFIQLNELSKDMGLSLKQVTNDIIQLSRDNQKYGYSLEQVMSFYKEFEGELKKGTVSAGQLSEYMKGMAETGTEKAVGIAALITSQDPNKVLANFTGNRAVGQEFAGLMAGTSPLEAAQIFRIINNPTADISNDPALAPIAAKYNLDTNTRKRLNPEVERYIMAVSQTFAGESGDLGSQALIYEKIMSLMGVNLPSNLYDRSLYNKGIQGLGDTSGIVSLDRGKELSSSMMTSLERELPKLTMLIERLNATLEQAMQNLINDALKELSKDDTNWLKLAQDMKKGMSESFLPVLRQLGIGTENQKEANNKKIELSSKSYNELVEINKSLAKLAKRTDSQSASAIDGYDNWFPWDTEPEKAILSKLIKSKA